jgi:hypothetical protein
VEEEEEGGKDKLLILGLVRRRRVNDGNRSIWLTNIRLPESESCKGVIAITVKLLSIYDIKNTQSTNA